MYIPRCVSLRFFYEYNRSTNLCNWVAEILLYFCIKQKWISYE